MFEDLVAFLHLEFCGKPMMKSGALSLTQRGKDLSVSCKER